MPILTLNELLTILFEDATPAEIREYAAASNMTPLAFLDHLDNVAALTE